VRADSPAEGTGFEPLVPPLNELLSPAKTKRSHFESAIVLRGTTEEAPLASRRRGANCADIILDVLHRGRFGH
jgi:hypothetical protein